MNTYTKEIIGIIALVLAGCVVFFLSAFAPQSAQMPAGEVPVSGDVQGKINIEEVCASALTYMTFPDSAAVDTFIAECKEGKHPEVIQQYFEQMQVGDGAQI